MRKTMMLFTLLIALSFMFITGCVTKEREIRTEQAQPTVKKEIVVVQPPPPAPRVEVRSAPPAPTYTWVPGFWEWNGQDYTWVPGYWRQ